MMLLLPGSLPTDRATLNALCENLPSHVELAKWLRACQVETVDGSWSDWERRLLLALQREGIKQEMRSFATPLHASLGLTDLTPLDPSQLQLSEEDSRALCEASDAHLHEDGVRLEFVSPNEWRVVTQREIKVLTERPDWIVGESMRPNLPRGDDGRLVERWMNELQMLLFNHPVNAARSEQRLPPVNVVWLWGFDGLARTPSDTVDARMLHAFRAGDVAGWQEAFRDLGAKLVACDTVVLGDSRPRLKLTKKASGFFARLATKFSAPQLSDVLRSLQDELSYEAGARSASPVKR